jgi:hypothetical protein
MSADHSQTSVKLKDGRLAGLPILTLMAARVRVTVVKSCAGNRRYSMRRASVLMVGRGTCRTGPCQNTHAGDCGTDTWGTWGTCCRAAWRACCACWTCFRSALCQRQHNTPVWVVYVLLEKSSMIVKGSHENFHWDGMGLYHRLPRVCWPILHHVTDHLIQVPVLCTFRISQSSIFVKPDYLYSWKETMCHDNLWQWYDTGYTEHILKSVQHNKLQ